MSAKVQQIKPKSDVCELHEVTVIRQIDPISSNNNKAQHNQQRTCVKDKENLSGGINLGGTSI